MSGANKPDAPARVPWQLRVLERMRTRNKPAALSGKVQDCAASGNFGPVAPPDAADADGDGERLFLPRFQRTPNGRDWC